MNLIASVNRRDLHTFFTLFERVTELRGWQDAECNLLLQCALTGRAESAYSDLSVEDSVKFIKRFKAAVLKAYELVPEAYCRRFQTWKC